MVYVRKETSLKDALKLMLIQDCRYAVVRKGSREVGMIGEKRLREVLNRSIMEESKDDQSGYLESIQRKLASLRKTVNDKSRESASISMSMN